MLALLTNKAATKTPNPHRAEVDFSAEKMGGQSEHTDNASCDLVLAETPDVGPYQVRTTGMTAQNSLERAGIGIVLTIC
jgi:hypothetical protein